MVQSMGVHETMRLAAWTLLVGACVLGGACSSSSRSAPDAADATVSTPPPREYFPMRADSSTQGQADDSAEPSTAPSPVPTDSSGQGQVDARAEASGALHCNFDVTPPPPDGWTAYPGFDANCHFYVPASTAQLPPPIQWEPCSGNTPSGIACQQMKYDWQAYDGHIDGASRAWLRPDGTVVLGVSRWVDCGSIYRMIADADGPVHSAILEMPSATDCTIGSQRSLNEGKVVYTSWESVKPFRVGAIGGGIDDLTPHTYRSYSDGISREYRAGGMALLEWGPSFPLLSWADGTQVSSLTFTGTDRSLQPVGFQFSGGALFFSMESRTSGHVAVYTQDGGVVDLITAGNDPTRASIDLGTDGHDLVWNELSNPTGTTSAPFANAAWMTSRFATAPADLQIRKLRAEPSPFASGIPFVVGCGYAVQYAYGTGTYVGVRIVRLSDGQSWPLLTQNGVDSWHWTDPLAVTCSEVFMTVHDNGDQNIARVRIDSLGPGEPAN
jgi:hypothetical protein